MKNMLELLLLNIANAKLNENKHSPVEKINAPSPVVASVLDYIELHMCEKITLEDIAKNVGYSISRISSMFKKEMGDSIIHCLINKRVQRACKLITDGEKSIKDISEMLAFDSVQYFSYQFKKIVGITPAQFREKSKTDLSYLDIVFSKVANRDDPPADEENPPE